MTTDLKKTTWFGFIDESGVLSNDSFQRFFAIGLLLLPDTARLFQNLQPIRERCLAELDPARPFEFKFSALTQGSLPFYKRLVQAVLNESAAHVSIRVVDKSSKGHTSGFPGTWDAYLKYSETALLETQRRLPDSDSAKVIVFADHLSKPKNHPECYEDRMRQLPFVPNALMLESHACIFVQAIDVLCGCVLNHFYREREPSRGYKSCKLELADHVAELLGVGSLIRINQPRFRVWEVDP